MNVMSLLRTWLYGIIWLLLCPLSAFTHAACSSPNTAITQSNPNSDYTDNGDGTVTHEPTGLMWMRCVIGQEWDGVNSCNDTFDVGSETPITWQTALTAARNSTFAGHEDWRVPNKNELATLIEDQCFNPALNEAIFPGTADSTVLWSSSPSAENATDVWAVDLTFGTITSRAKNLDGSVRLVRLGQ